jgi:hypothetical protein
MKWMKWWVLGVTALVVAGSATAQGFRRGPGGPISLILEYPEVQKELKLDEAQLDLLKQLGAEAQKKAEQNRPSFNREEFMNLSAEEREKRMRQFREEAEKRSAEQEKQIAEILEPKQVARFKQLRIQRDGIRALSRKDVQDGLKLTPDQRQKVAAAFQANEEAGRAMFQSFQNGQRPSREEMMQKFRQMNDELTAKLTAVLTESQKTQWKAMQGTPFQFPQRGPGFGPPR